MIARAFGPCPPPNSHATFNSTHVVVLHLWVIGVAPRCNCSWVVLMRYSPPLCSAFSLKFLGDVSPAVVAVASRRCWSCFNLSFARLEIRPLFANGRPNRRGTPSFSYFDTHARLPGKDFPGVCQRVSRNTLFAQENYLQSSMKR